MKALILGCLGTTLSVEEKAHFKRIQPFGFILMARNCQTPEQTLQLVEDLKSCVDHPNPPILIDQEGGRVQRLNQWCSFPAAETYITQPEALVPEITRMSYALQSVGVSVNCTPCCDLVFKDADPIIGDRALGSTVDGVVALADQWMRTQASHSITSVIKHIPGHGRAKGDSHLMLPRVDTSLEELKATDMNVFRQLSALHTNAWGMTAHIVYDALDPDLPATLSPVVIQKWIREWIGFQGILLSDCLHMSALSGPLDKRAEQSLQAGCDVALFCTIADMDAQNEVAKGCGELLRAW